MRYVVIIFLKKWEYGRVGLFAACLLGISSFILSLLLSLGELTKLFCSNFVGIWILSVARFTI